MIYTIVNSFAIWTDAQGIKSRTRINSVDNISLEGIARLRELILDLAVSGKLVPQDPNEEPAYKLLKKIELEKQILIKERKLTLQKKQLPISDKEKPFKLSQSWEWVRLTDIGNIFNGNSIDATTKETKYTNNKGIPYIATKDVGYGWNMLDYDNGISIPEGEMNFKLAHKGSVLICAEGGSAGKKCGITNKDIYFGNKLFAIELFGNIPSKYILSNYLSSIFSRQFKSKLTGIIGGISIQKFIDIVIPLPPLAEQHRIVAKVDELIALCDKLEEEQFNNLKTHQVLVKTLLETLTQAVDANGLQTAWERIYEYFDILFCTEDSIEQLKQTILQLAVMGKLVKQDPNDESASELIKKIAKEKERLAKEGIIKKITPLPKIAESEKPFELPNGWQFCRLDELCSIITKGSSPKWQGVSYTENPNDILFVTSENVGSYKLLLESKKYVELKFNEIEPKSILQKGDFLMNIVGGSIGRTAIYNIGDLANINQAVCLIRMLPEFINPQFFLHFFNSSICVSYMFDKQVDNARANLSMGNISKFVMPFPSLAEQNRIVEKIESLFLICDSIKDKLVKAQELKVLLSKTIIEKAVE